MYSLSYGNSKMQRYVKKTLRQGSFAFLTRPARALVPTPLPQKSPFPYPSNTPPILYLYPTYTLPILYQYSTYILSIFRLYTPSTPFLPLHPVFSTLDLFAPSSPRPQNSHRNTAYCTISNSKDDNFLKKSFAISEICCNFASGFDES